MVQNLLKEQAQGAVQGSPATEVALKQDAL